MAMTVIWTGMTVGALVFSLALGNQAELAPAALDGASSAVQLGISMAGVLCLWMGVMEVMQRSGLAEKLARLLKPVLGRCSRTLPRTRGPWTPWRPMSLRIYWGWGTRRRPWAWRRPGG